MADSSTGTVNIQDEPRASCAKKEKKWSKNKQTKPILIMSKAHRSQPKGLPVVKSE